MAYLKEPKVLSSAEETVNMSRRRKENIVLTWNGEK